MTLYDNAPTDLNVARGILNGHELGPLQVEYRAYISAPAALVFHAVADHERLCQSIPNLTKVTLYETEEGVIRKCDFGNDMVIDQHIVHFQPPSLFAYSITTPNPLGIRQHCAIATCQTHEDGTLLNWQHHFDHDDLGAMLAMLNTIFEHIITGLLEEFGGHTLYK